MKDYELDKEEILNKYKTSIKGLTNEERNRRLRNDGLNEIKDKNKNNIFKIIINQFKDFLVWLLIISAIVSFLIDRKDYIDSLIIISVVLLNAILGIIQEEKANLAVEKIKRLTDFKVSVLVDSKIEKIDAKNIVVGDIVKLEEGDYIPADLRILEENSLEVIESNITGESRKVRKTSKIVKDTSSLGNMTNMLFSSTYVVKGSCIAIVISTGDNTEIGKIAKTISHQEETKSPLEKDINKLSKVLGISVIVISLIVYILELISSKDILSSFKSAVALAVAAIPEGLQAVITMVLAIGVLKMSKKKTIVRKLKSVETIGAINVIALDKTGTITTGKLELVNAINSNLKIDKSLLDLAYLSSIDSKDDLEQAIINKTNIKRPENILVKSFDSKRKMSTVTYKEHNLYISYTKGAFEVVLSNSINKDKKYFLSANEYAKKSYRVLALAKKTSNTLEDSSNEKNMTFLGFLLFEDEIRYDVKLSIKTAISAGITPIMITGDYIETAKAIAKKVGLYKGCDLVYTKDMLDSITDEELKKVLHHIKIFARVDPMDKLRIIKLHQELGNIVSFTGDGVNDAAALKASDIGISMGDGSDIAHASSNVILLDNSFNTIVSSIEEGRRIYKNIKKTIRYLISSNIGEVVLILIGAILSINNKDFGLPLLPIHLLFVNLVTDSLPAIAIGLDNTETNLMNEPPRKTSHGFFSKKELITILLEGILMGSLTIISYIIGKTHSTSAYYAMTMAFITISASQLFHAYNINNNSKLKNVFKNKYLNLSFIIGLIIIFSITFIFNDTFKFERLSKIDLLISLSLSLVLYIISIVIKYLSNHQNHL